MTSPAATTDMGAPENSQPSSAALRTLNMMKADGGRVREEHAASYQGRGRAARARGGENQEGEGEHAQNHT